MSSTGLRGQRPGDRRDGIITAAAELFAAKGFAAAAVDEIGARVGVTGPALYRHFKGKEALLDAVVLATVTAFAGIPGLEDSSVPVDRIVEGVVATALDHPAMVATYVRERHRLVGQARRDLHEVERRMFLPWLRASLEARPEVGEGPMAERQLGVLAAM